MNRICCLLLIYVFSCACNEQDNRDGHYGNKALPNFKVQLIDSITYSTSFEQIKSGPAVLFFFQPDCPFCMEQLKVLVKDSVDLQAVHIYMVTIVPFKFMKNYCNDFKLDRQKNITLFRDTERFLPKYFELTTVPFLAVYDSTHKLKQTYNGRVDAETILQNIYDRKP